MTTGWSGIVVVVCALGMMGASAASGGESGPESAPDGWRVESARDEIAPRSWVETGARTRDGWALGLEGTGTTSVDGRWVKRVPAQAGLYYAFESRYRADGVADPIRSVLARVVWFDAEGRQLGPAEFPETRPESDNDGSRIVAATYQAPERATQAQLELHLRWTPRGRVLWSDVRFGLSSAPEPRRVRLASVNHRPRGSSSPTENVERFAALVEEAGRRGADVVCLPEGITVVGTGLKYADVAEPIPGPSTRRLGEAARTHGIYIVAGLYEREGRAIYNTSVLIGRDGSLIGKYRKVCLPREEIEGGITPGTDYPVFDTDFGRVGMMICWDVHFPEVARELAARGAEVILLPIWGGNETLARARAIENQVYLVASGYDFQTAIYDKAGERIATTTEDPDIILTPVDLNERKIWPWLGDWRARIWREGPSRPAHSPGEGP